MRWFKHMTHSANDEKLSKIRDVFGLEGYGFWWSVVEIVAEKLDENEQTSVTFSAKKWGNMLGISAKKFQTLAEFCANLGLFSIKNGRNELTVSIPNILKFRDEYTEKQSRKSGQCRDKLRPSRARVPDTETETDTDLKTPLPPEGEIASVGEPTPSAKPSRERVRFVKPAPEQVCAYCLERNNGISGQEFYDFYESKGWFIGKNRMKDWQAAVRTWEQGRFKSQASRASPAPAPYASAAERKAQKMAQDGEEALAARIKAREAMRDGKHGDYGGRVGGAVFSLPATMPG